MRRFERLRILRRLDRRRVDHHVGLADLFGGVALVDLGAEGLQAVGDVAFYEIRPGHLVAPVEQDSGNRTHADAADAHHVDVVNAPELGLSASFHFGHNF